MPGIGPLLASTASASSYLPIIATLVRSLSIIPDQLRSRRTHVWLMREDEADAIAHPLSRIAARHAPVKMTGETSDVLDGLEAAVGTGTYAVRAYMSEKELDEAAGSGLQPPATPTEGVP